MTETRKFSERLRRLPGQLLLALVNATAVLVIVAGIVVIFAFNSVNESAARLAGSVTGAVAAEMKIQPQQLLSSIDALNTEIDAYLAASSTQRSARADQLEASITGLSDALTQLNDTLSAESLRLTDESIRSAVDALTDGLLQLRSCQPETS
jgi:hypothetical protein